MIDKAIARITEQAMKLNHGLATVIEEYLTDRCTTNEVAEKLLDENKTVSEIYNKIKNHARDLAKDRFAMMKDDELYGMIDEYYGLDHASASHKASAPAPKVDVFDFF